MQAIMVSELGGPEVLRPAETGMPRPGPGEVLVRVPTLDGAARAASDGALIATPVYAELPDRPQVRWQPYDAQPRGSRLIRMAPWFDDGSLTVTVQARCYWQDAAQAHRAVENGHVPGKLALIVDDDLAAAMEV